jgi:hypothetical protein
MNSCPVPTAQALQAEGALCYTCLSQKANCILTNFLHTRPQFLACGVQVSNCGLVFKHILLNFVFLKSGQFLSKLTEILAQYRQHLGTLESRVEAQMACTNVRDIAISIKLLAFSPKWKVKSSMAKKRKHLDLGIFTKKTLLVHTWDFGKWPKLLFL